MNSPPARVGLIGVTGFGHVHYRMCMEAHRQGSISLDACVIINLEVVPHIFEELKAIGCDVLSSADTLFHDYAGKLDLVMIPTGIATHAPFTIRALEMGASVFVEKPAAGTVAEVDAMMQAEQVNDGFVAVGFQDVFRRDLQQLKRDLVSGKYGALRSARVLGCWPRPLSYFERNNWAGKIEVDGAIINDSPANNALAHYVNLALFLAGSEFESSAVALETEAELRRVNAIDSFDTITSITQLEGATTLHMGLTHACDNQKDVTRITLLTEQCRIVLNFGDQETRVESHDGELIEMLPSDYTSTRDWLMPDLLRRLRGEEQFVCSLAIARGHTQLIESLHASGEIRDFPEHLIQSKDWRNSPLRYIPEISQRMDSAGKRESLLSDIEREQ